MNKARASPDASGCGRVFFFFFLSTQCLRRCNRDGRNDPTPNAETVPAHACRTAGSLELSPRVGPRKCNYARLPSVGDEWRFPLAWDSCYGHSNQ